MSSFIRRIVAGASVMALLGLSALPAGAQVTTGTIVGTVKDQQGAAVPGATVTITNQGKGTSSSHTTDAGGSFMAPFLIPGTYDLAVELAGFRKYTHKGVVLQVNQRARVDATLEVGGLTEVTEVIGLAPLTRTDSGEVGEVIDERAVRELPLNGRNFATLVYLAPGITPGQAGENLSGASTFNPRGASNFNALGSQANTNAWLVDGIDNNEFTFNTVIVQPTVESVREFKVLTGTFSAEFGRGAGVVSVSTKSGNNEWHGTAFEYLRNEKFDAKNFFALPTATKAPLDRHQYGAALSGPIIKNKTFFFVDWSGLREDRGQVFVNTVPTEAMRRGDFSDYRDRNGNLILIYDPLTTQVNPNGAGFVRQPFPGNIIPANRLDQVGLNVGSIYPLPNAPGYFDNYTSTVNRSVRGNSFTGRVDHRQGDRDSFFVRFSYEKFSLDAPQGQAACCLETPASAAAQFDLGPFVAGIQNTRLTTMGGVMNWTHLFGPTVVNELRIGFAKTNPETVQSDYGTQAATSLGIQGINVNEFATGLPNLNIQDVTGLSGGPAFLPVNPKQIHYQIEDTLSWVTGRHSLKTGYRYILRKPSPYTNRNTRSSIAINRNLTNNPLTNSQGSGYATLLLGMTTGGSRGFLLDVFDYTNSEHSIFVQDDWKLSNRRHAQPRPALRGLHPGHRAREPAAELRPRGHAARLRRRGRHHGAREQGDALGQPRAAHRRRLGRDRRREERGARGLRQELLPGPARGRQPARAERAELDLAELQLSRRTRSSTRPIASRGCRTPSPRSCRCSRERRRSSTRPTRPCSATPSPTRRRTWTPGR